MRVLRFLMIPLVIGLLVVIGMFLNPPRRADRDEIAWGPSDAARPSKAGTSSKEDRVVATVNGEAIHESDLAVSLPKGSFGMEATQARKEKLDRMIEALTLRQFLRSQKVEVPASEVDKEIENLRKYPPAAGCACCRYDSLEQFMQANYLDMKELRGLIANDIGFQKHIEAQWEKDCPPGETRTKRIQEERPRMEESYAKVSHVFFNTFQNSAFQANPKAARKTISAKAQAAWTDLQKGKAFETVVKEVSEDAISRPKGGSLGCVPTYAFGRDFANVVAALKCGEYSTPFESPWGFHIVRREAMKDDDVWDLLRSEWMDEKHAEVLNTIRLNAKIEH